MKASRGVRVVLGAGVSIGLAANIGGWLLAWTTRNTQAHSVFVKLFEFGVVSLAITASFATIHAVRRQHWPLAVKWPVGVVLGMIAAVAVGACAAYWPWVVVYRLFPQSSWSVP